MNKKPLKIITLFSGIGCQEMALKNLNIPYELINWCEYDDKISNCYKILHNASSNNNLNDITKLDIDNYNNNIEIDLLTNSFPCCSFSNQGNKKGFNCNKNGTLFDISFKFINKVKPKVVLFENVKTIKNKNYKGDVYIKNKMKSIGYKCFDKVLNSVNYGIPQSRDRWFCICFLDNSINFEFPNGFPLIKKVKDIVDINEINRKCPTSIKPYYDKKYHNIKKNKNGVIKLFDGYLDKYFNSGHTVYRIFSYEGACPTLLASGTEGSNFFELNGLLNSLEKCRLMGISDDDYYKLKDYNISTSLFNKITGNGIVVNVLENIFKKIYK